MTRLAYLVSRYPGISHTFISREVAALRRMGVNIDTFSVRSAFDDELVDDAMRDEARSTFTLFRQPLHKFVAALIAEAVRAPVAYFRTLGKALAHRVPGARGFFISFVYFAEAMVLARELRRREITRLHNHFGNSGATVGFLAASFLRIPWSFTIHGISETDYPAGLLLAKKVEAANFVVCASYFMQAQAMRVAPTDCWNKFHIVHCGLDLPSVPPRATSPGVRRIVCAGRLSCEKGHAGLLDAFSTVLRKFPDLELVLVGDGPERGALSALASDLGVSNHVRFLGHTSERRTLEEIAAADMLVLPSFMEGLPIVLMEAMAIGTPVIASRVAGVPELVVDGESGLLFTPSDWDQLAACINRLAGDEDLRKRLADGGLSAVRSGFDIDRSAAQLLSIFGIESRQ